jgi:hypothetical protein
LVSDLLSKDTDKAWEGWMGRLDQEMRNDEESYTKFAEVVLSCIVGKSSWKLNCGTKKLNEFVTVSDEAFGLLLMHNSWELWRTMGDNARQGKPIGKAKREGDGGGFQGLMTKYTSNGAYVKKNQGWSEEGLDCFLDLVERVREDRKHDGLKAAGESFQEKFKAKMAERYKKRMHQVQFDESGETTGEGVKPRFARKMHFDE